MDIKEFSRCLVEYINNNYDNFEVVENEVIKNNGLKLLSIILKRPNVNIYPTIYLDYYYPRYINGESISSLAKDIIKLDEKTTFEGTLAEDFFCDFEKIKEHIYIKLINTTKNEELLKDTPSKGFLDLSEVVYVDVFDTFKINASITVKNEHIEKWGINKEELITTAYDNTKNLNSSIRSIMDMFGESAEDEKMFVMTCEEAMFGAACMTFDDRLDEFLKNRSLGVYIIPSSIHEVLLVPDDGKIEPGLINSMIETVNKETLSYDEVLSDHAYYYSVENGYSIVWNL